MRKKYRGMILAAAILGAMYAVTACAAETEEGAAVKPESRNYGASTHITETEEESESSKDGTATITADYSALDYGDGEITVISEMEAFSDAACEDRLDLQVASAAGEKIVCQLEKEDIPETVYLIPPIISVSRKVEKTELSARGEEDVSSVGFYIKDVFVQKVRGFLQKEPSWYEVNVIIASETGEYPDHLKMVSDGKIYPEAQSMRFSYPDPAVQILSEYSFQYKVSDDAAAALEILDHASFVYYRILRLEAANDWDFSCEGAKLQIVEAAVNG